MTLEIHASFSGVLEAASAVFGTAVGRAGLLCGALLAIALPL